MSGARLVRGPIRLGMVGSRPPPIGGVTVLFEALVRALAARQDVSLRLVEVPVSRGSLARRMGGGAAVVAQMARILPSVDILTVHLPTPVLPFIGPPAVLLAGAWRRPVLLRKFGGTDYRELHRPQAALAAWAARRADVYLAEARGLVRAAREAGVGRAYWFPNHRSCGAALGEPRAACRRLVFVGHVRRTKGIPELLEAAAGLDLPEPVDIYGPLFDGYSARSFEGLKNVRYCGVLEPTQVAGRLRDYDALVLPTYHEGEGYPGVLLEAYCAGLPVVTTSWRVVPEIVNERCGLLVPVRDARALAAALHRLVTDSVLYQALGRGARLQGGRFATERWADVFVRLCRATLARHRAAASDPHQRRLGS